MDGLAERGGDGHGQALGVELGEELGGLGDREAGRRELFHGGEDGERVVAGGPALVREVFRGGEVGLVGEGVDREEHDVGQLRGQADLAQAGHDVLEARVA